MPTAKEVLDQIKDQEIEWVDLRFTDPRGKWQHLTMVSTVLGEDELEDGLMFDGSSIAGWKAIQRFAEPVAPHVGPVVLASLGAVAVNATSAWLLVRVRHHGGSLSRAS